MERCDNGAEMAATISTFESSGERTEELYPNNELKNIVPANFLTVSNFFDRISHAHFDSIVMSILSTLPCLCGGSTVSQEKGMHGRSIILYMLLLAPSGVGKTSIASLCRKYLLSWIEHELHTSHQDDGKAQIDSIQDVFLDGASAEGLEASLLAGSAPHLLIDEFGKFASASKNDVIKLAFLRMLMQVFDSGTLVTRKLKDTKNTKLVMIKGMGLFAASTIGKSNLAPADMRNMISDGLLNRFLVIFGKFKPIPLRQELTHQEAATVENFAKKFHEFASNKQFWLGEEARSQYEAFHAQVNKKYYHKYMIEDDTAGLDVRLLTVSQRIAMLFQVCKNIQEGCPNRSEIEADSMERAIRLINYLDQNHFDQILLYANSHDGRPTIEDRLNQQFAKHGERTLRDLVRNLNKVSTDDVHRTLQRMIVKGLVEQNEAGLFRRK